MLPIRLELKNFLPFRSPDPILFEGVHLACLTGSNGAGKSSILDAITWVLWGKARARRDEELVHLGQQEMYVQIDFEQEDVNYRVLRRRSRGKRGQGTLDLFVVQDDGQLLTINEASVRATQNKIDTILRLDYDTFTHSAFLQQGKASAFTTKSPAERKRILSDILGLEQWATYEDRTKEKLKQLQAEIQVYEARLQDIDIELEKQPQYQRDMEQSQVAYEEALEATNRAQELLDEVAHAPAELKRAQQQQAGYERRIREFENDLLSVDAEIERVGDNITAYQTITDQQPEIEAGYQALQEAREAQTALADKLQQMKDLDAQTHALERDLDMAHAELEREKGSYQTVIHELEQASSEDPHDQYSQVQAEIADLEVLETEQSQVQATIQQLNEEKSGLDVLQNTLTADGKKLSERLQQLDAAEGATCPLCGQPLDEEHRAELLQEITQERDEKRDEYRNTRQRIQTIAVDTKEHQRHVDDLGTSIQQLPYLRRKLGGLQEQVERLSDTQTRLHQEKAALAEVEKVLASEAFGQDIREQLAALQAQREQVAYDESVHSNTQETLQKYRDYDQQQMQLQVALNSLPAEEAALEAAKKRKKRLQKALKDEQASLETIQQEIEQLEVLKQEEQKRRLEVNKQRTTMTSAQTRFISAQQQLAALETQEARKLEFEQRKEETLHQEGIYKELRLAFSKNGVPAMVIETAIPDIEAEANTLLGRMTDGRMTLRLTTQREKITGGTAETLDIEIADELGTRGYEMYSGGEAFRINFAIRVALSKVLARRAGAHLRTLFIDEGFGTQDEDGRSKLVEAITAVQNDFDLILVITHIDELRDQFPAHIVVEKGNEGSQVHIR